MRARTRSAMVGAMSPELRPGLWVFATAPAGEEAALVDLALATMREEEGLSVVLPVEEARTHGLPVEPAMRLITLRVHSALDGVGLTAAVAGALAAPGIACNVVAGHHHDHLLVPAPRAHEALGVLRALAAAAAAPGAAPPTDHAGRPEHRAGRRRGADGPCAGTRVAGR